MTLGYGIDVSHHQDPAALPYESQFRGRVDFVIARAGYGTARDKHVEEHVRRARAIGAKVGLYLFFRISQPLEDQFARLLEVAHAVGLGPGDIVPTLDIEADPIPKRQNVAPSWSDPARALVDRVVGTWGDALVYITRAEWLMLGSPAWVLERPLWVAHYTGASRPAVPGTGVEPVIWQHRVGPFSPAGPGGYDKVRPELDQNRLLGQLPLIQGVTDDPIDEELRERARGLVAAHLEDEGMRLVRGHAIDDGPEEDRLA